MLYGQYSGYTLKLTMYISENVQHLNFAIVDISQTQTKDFIFTVFEGNSISSVSVCLRRKKKL